MDAHNNISNFPDDFPIAGLTVKQFIELCVSLGFGNRSNSHPNKPESPPPELNFTFSNKFNELYFNGFSTLSKSCSLPLSGVVAISRVPLVYHAPSAYPIKIEK